MLEPYKLAKPDLSNIDEAGLNKKFKENTDVFMEAIHTVSEPIYHFWDKIQYSTIVPLSLVIKEAPTQYGMAYVYSEQDDFDLTYFYDFHMRKLMQALKNFKAYLQRKIEENKNIQNLFRADYALNPRQIQALHYLLTKGEGHYINPSSYEVLCGISRTTAIADLKMIQKLNLVERKKVGKYVRYYGAPLLKDSLNKNIK